MTFCAFMALVTVVFLDVLSRELTGAGLHWAGQTGVYANIVVVLFGLGLASAGGQHLRPRFADGWLPENWAPVLIRLQQGLMSLFCLGFALLAVDIVLETRRLGEVSPVLGNLVWPIQLVLPLAFLIAFIRHLLFTVWPDLRPAAAASVVARRPGGGA